MQRIKSIGGHAVTIQSNSDLHVGCVAVTKSQLEGLLMDLIDYRTPYNFKPGDLVRLTRTMDSRGEFGIVKETRNISGRKGGEARVKRDYPTPMWYYMENLDIVSEQEFSHNVTLQVGDTVRLRPGSGYTYKFAKVRSISGGQLTVQFDNYDAVRALNHEHKPGEPYGHVCTLTRKWLELVGNPSEQGCIST